MIFSSSTLALGSSAWKVLTLFLIPIGGGIPAGVLLAKNQGIHWPLMSVLYFVSDIILACLFEPVVKLMVWTGRRSARVAKIVEAMKKWMKKSTAKYGTKLGPLQLIGISFAVDPMTGRTATAAAGHGFVSGWALAITGDMFYFWMLMVSTLWLSNILGDGTVATLIIVLVMTLAPGLLRKIRGKRV